VFSERQLLELHNNPDLLKDAIGVDAYESMRVEEPDFVSKLIVSNYLSQTQNVNAKQILNNYEAYSQSIGLSGNAINDANNIASSLNKAQELATEEKPVVTFKEGLSGAAKRGKGNLYQMYSLLGISDPIYQSLIDGKIRNIKDSERLLASDAPFITEGMKDFERFRLEKDREFIASTILLKSNEIKNFIEAQAQIESANLSQGYQKFIDSGKIPTSPKAFGEFLAGFMTEQTFQQVPMSLKTMMSGPAAPFTVFGDSLNMERAFEMMQHLRENGVDFNSQESLNAALSNEKLMSDASSRGLRKGIPIAIVSALSAYLPVKGKTMIGKFGREVATQAGFDAIGEVLGQSFATGDFDMQEVLLEVLGGTSQSVAEFSAKVATNVAKSPIAKILKNEDGSLKSQNEVALLEKFIPKEQREEMIEADPLVGSLVVGAIGGDQNSYNTLSSIIQSATKEVKAGVPGELKQLSQAVDDFESAQAEVQSNLDVVDETVGVELEGETVDTALPQTDPQSSATKKSGEMPIRPGDPRDAGIKSGIEEARSTREERLRQSKNTAIIELKSQIKRIKNRHKERVKKFEEKIKELKADKRESAKAERDMLLDFGTQIEQLWKALPLSIRGNTNPVSAILNPVTLEGRLSALDKFEERINKAIEKDFTKTREKTLRSILKNATKGNETAVSKRLGPSKDVVQKIHKISKSSKEENQAAMLEELSQLPEESEEGRGIATLYNAFSDLKSKNSKELNESIALADAIIKYGKDWRKQFKTRSKAKDQNLLKDYLEEVGIITPTKDGKQLALPSGKKGERSLDVLMSKEELQNKEDLKGVFSEILNGVDWYISAHDGIEQLIENLIRVPGKQYSGKLHDQITKKAHLSSEEFIDKQRVTREAAFDAFYAALSDQGLSPDAINDLFMNLRKPPNFAKGDRTGVYFESQPGYGFKEQPISRDQGIQLWMWRQDKTLQGSFDTMKWTDEVDAQLEAYIGKEGIALGQYMLSVYKEIGVEMNDVLFEVEGWKLPIIENYSPVSKKAKDSTISLDETMELDGIPRKHEKNNSMKLRVDQKAPLDATFGAIASFDKHITEMNHYVTHAELAHRMRNLFENQKVKDSIRQLYGPKRWGLIDHMIKNFTRGGVDYGKMDPFVSGLIRNVAVGKLAINYPSAIKQLGSIIAYANAMPAGEWLAGFMSFFPNAPSIIKTLLETKYIQNRINTTGDRDLRAIAESKSFQQAATGAKNWRDRLMILTRIHDVAAIMAGGWPIYKKAYDEAIASGKSISEAKKIAEFEFGFVSERAQQSSKPQNLSYFQHLLFSIFALQHLQLGQQTGDRLVEGVEYPGVRL